MKEKDKEILFSEEAIKWFADIMAKALLPDTKILEQLDIPTENIEIDAESFTYKIKSHESNNQENNTRKI